MKKNYTVENVEEFIQNTTIKITLLASLIIMLLNMSVHSGVIFIILSFTGYVRFYCLSDVIDVCIKKQTEELKHCLFNYALTCFVTAVLLEVSWRNYGKLCFIYGIIGTMSTNLIIMYKGILNSISKRNSF